MALTDLRDFIQQLEEEGDLVRITDPVDRKFELSGYIKNSSDVAGPALLFEDVKDSSVPVLGALYNNRRLMLKALQTTEENAISDYLEAIKNLSDKKCIFAPAAALACWRLFPLNKNLKMKREMYWEP